MKYVVRYCTQVAEALEPLPNPPRAGTTDTLPSRDQDQRQQQQDHRSLIMDLLQCPICLCIMTDSVTLETGHNFCAKCIEGWRERSTTCPITRRPVTRDPVPNHKLRDLVELIRDSQQYIASWSSVSNSVHQAFEVEPSDMHVPMPSASSTIPLPLSENLEVQLRMLQQQVQSKHPPSIIPAVNRLLDMLTQHKQQQQQERISRVLLMVGPAFSTANALHPEVALHLLRHQQLIPHLRNCMWGGSELAAGNAVALIAHLLNSDSAVLGHVGQYPTSRGVTREVAEGAHNGFCSDVSKLESFAMQPEPERIGLLLLRLLRNGNPVVCWQAAEALAALIDCPGTTEYCKAGLKRLMEGKGLTEQQLMDGWFGRLLEVVEVYCTTRPMVAAAAGLVVKGVCHPDLFPDGTMICLVVSRYCSTSISGNGMCLGQAVVQLLESDDDLVKQRAGFLVEGLGCGVAWEPGVWMGTWKGLSALLWGTNSHNNIVGIRGLRLMLSHQPLGRTGQPQWEHKLSRKCFETLQGLLSLLERVPPPGAAASVSGEAKLGVQLLAELLQQLRGRSDQLKQLRARWEQLGPLLKRIKGIRPKCEAQRAAEQAMGYLQEWIR